MATIFTVGHSVHEAGEFMGLLHTHGVQVLVDVRRHPASRRVPQFNSGPLAETLRSGGIEYEHAEELGGRRSPVPDSPNGAWRNDQFQGYADHMATPEFRAALERLVADERRTAVMCAEARWVNCHRRLMADALTAQGHEVRHIDGRGAIERHELTDFAVVRDGEVTYPPVQATLDV
jgi:uncharacterized protein (DUF488 family)